MPSYVLSIGIPPGKGYDIYDDLVEQVSSEIGALFDGTGLSLETGLRDYFIEGTRQQLQDIMRRVEAIGGLIYTLSEGEDSGSQ